MDVDLIKTLGPLLTVIVILAKVIDRLVPSPTEKLLRQIANQTSELHTSHLGDTAHDAEGRLKWWFPQNMVDTLKDILNTQKETLATLKELSKHMDMGAVLGEAQMMQAEAMKSLAESAAKGPEN